MGDLGNFRPQRFTDLVGQAELINKLSKKVSAFQFNGRVVSHLLLTGGAGYGKTTVAQVMANEMGVDFRYLMGPKIASADQLLAEFEKVGAHGVIALDEIHALPISLQESLYEAMEDGIFKWYDVKARENKTLVLKPFTLIGMTTVLGKVLSPLQRRFDIVELVPFSIAELAQVIKWSALRNYDVCVPDACAFWLGGISRGTPANANQVLNAMVVEAESNGIGVVSECDFTDEMVWSMLGTEGLDPYIGLDRRTRRYLVTLLRRKRLGLASLATMLGESEETLLSTIEPFLVREDIRGGALVVIGPAGREAMPAARAYIEECQALQKTRGLFRTENLTL